MAEAAARVTTPATAALMASLMSLFMVQILRTGLKKPMDSPPPDYSKPAWMEAPCIGPRDPVTPVFVTYPTDLLGIRPGVRYNAAQFDVARSGLKSPRTCL